MSTNLKICVIAVGYNRPDAINRLLHSLERADYENDRVDLLVSIDKGARQQEVIEVAEKFTWEHGEKKIRAFSERQGLRPHIIQCGDVVENYDAVVILEDDISVSRSFYSYVKQCVAFYGDNEKIAGISLYKHHINPGNLFFFEPEYNGFDVYLMQFAQSWGQCWTKGMWQKFRAWYNENENFVFTEENKDFLRNIPRNIRLWGNHSWMRYYMVYIVEKDLYYVYPYHALTTNHTEAGQHNSIDSNAFQISLATGKIDYRFPEFDEAVRYDIYFERMNFKVKGYEDKKVILDLYGNKENFSGGDILISSANLPYHVLNTWKLKYRPQEINCILPEEGDGFYVYDLSRQDGPPKKSFEKDRIKYDVRALNWRQLLKYSLLCLFEGIKRKLKIK